MKKKVLFIMHFCPPVFGSNVVGSMIKDSKIINDSFISRYVKIKSSSDLDKIGRFEFRKLYLLSELIFSSLYQIIVFHPDIVYFTPSVKGLAFYRDFVLIFFIKTYCLFFNKEIFYHYHTKGIKKLMKRPGIYSVLTKLFLNRVNIILISEKLAGDIDTVKSYKKIHYLNNGIKNPINSEELESIRKLRESTSGLKILYLSNIKESKGALIAFEAFRMVYQKKVYNMELKFVGGFSEPETLDVLRRKISEHSMENAIEIAGPKFNDEKSEYLKQSHILLFPTYYPKEVFPLVILEAMSFELPVITSFEGGIPDIVDEGITGFMINPDELDIIVNRLELLIGDQSKRMEMGRKGRDKYLSKFQAHHFEQNLIRILNGGS